MTFWNTRENQSPKSIELETQRVLVELNQMVRNLSHKTGNISETVNNLESVVYTDPHSIVNQLTLTNEKLSRLEEAQKKQDATLETNSNKIRKLESEVQGLTTEAIKRSKLVNTVMGAVIGVITPVMLYATVIKNPQDALKDNQYEQLNYRMNVLLENVRGTQKELERRAPIIEKLQK